MQQLSPDCPFSPDGALRVEGIFPSLSAVLERDLAAKNKPGAFLTRRQSRFIYSSGQSSENHPVIPMPVAGPVPPISLNCDGLVLSAGHSPNPLPTYLITTQGLRQLSQALASRSHPWQQHLYSPRYERICQKWDPDK